MLASISLTIEDIPIIYLFRFASGDSESNWPISDREHSAAKYLACFRVIRSHENYHRKYEIKKKKVKNVKAKRIV